MPEEWRPVAEFTGVYEVSNLGRVRRVSTGMGARAGRLITPHTLSNGYVHVRLSVQSRHFNRYPHRLVALAFLGNPKMGEEVNHIDGVKANNRVTNLEWISRSENHRHAFRLGLRSHEGLFNGEKNGRAVISAQDAERIRALRGVVPQKVLAKEYGLTQGHISRIQRGVAWGRQDGPPTARSIL